MRRWTSTAIIFLGIPAVVLGLVLAGVWLATRHLGEGIGDVLGDAIWEGLGEEMTSAALGGREPDLVVAPGTEGHIKGPMIDVGSQYHYYVEEDDRTVVAADVELPAKVWHVPVATYDGRPRRDFDQDRLRPAVYAFSVLVVQLVDEKGELRGRTRVTIRSVGDTPHRRGTRWRDTGVARFIFVRPGTYTIGAEGVTGEVTVGTSETVWCTLSPSGLKVDKREPHKSLK